MENHRKTKNKSVYEPDSKIRESVTCGEGINTPQHRPKTVPLIKWIKILKNIIFSQIITIIMRLKTKQIYIKKTKQTRHAYKNHTNKYN